VPVEDARHFGVVAAAGDGRIERFVEKPRSRAELPGATGHTVLASMGIYVFGANFLTRVLTIDALTPGSRHDFGADILPKLVRNARVFAHALRADGSAAPYWRDIGTLRAYWQAHMDLLGPAPLAAFGDAAWPIGRFAPPRAIAAPVPTSRGGAIERSIVGGNCHVAGRAQRSVLFDNVEIGAGAVVVDSVLLPGARVGSGSRLRGVIVGEGCQVRDGAIFELAGPSEEPIVLADDRDGGTPFALTA
jgi:glucose-1-phosphate adenylyltransferase